jgi:predicted 3-demethylubiquinone-9 3-methyltransferase (glyoxalase superfamily)
MGHSQIIPCLWLDDQAKAAAACYVRALTGPSKEDVA